MRERREEVGVRGRKVRGRGRREEERQKGMKGMTNP